MTPVKCQAYTHREKGIHAKIASHLHEQSIPAALAVCHFPSAISDILYTYCL